MAVITNPSGRVVNKIAKKVKMMFFKQLVEKISPKIETGLCVMDFIENPRSPLEECNENFMEVINIKNVQPENVDCNNNVNIVIIEKANEKSGEIKNEIKAPKRKPPTKDEKEKLAKKRKIEKASKKMLRNKKTAVNKPKKSDQIKKIKPKKKLVKANNILLKPNLLQPKTMKKPKIIYTVSNPKIRKLQQPMERARQYKAVR